MLYHSTYHNNVSPLYCRGSWVANGCLLWPLWHIVTHSRTCKNIYLFFPPHIHWHIVPHFEHTSFGIFKNILRLVLLSSCLIHHSVFLCFVSCCAGSNTWHRTTSDAAGAWHFLLAEKPVVFDEHGHWMTDGASVCGKIVCGCGDSCSQNGVLTCSEKMPVSIYYIKCIKNSSVIWMICKLLQVRNVIIVIEVMVEIDFIQWFVLHFVHHIICTWHHSGEFIILLFYGWSKHFSEQAIHNQGNTLDAVHIDYAPSGQVGQGGHTLLLWSRLCGIDPCQLWHTTRQLAGQANKFCYLVQLAALDYVLFIW
jgi:hypothetical protein